MNDACDQSVSVTDVRFEYLREALGIGVPRPRVSWTTVTGVRDWHQTAYDIQQTAPDGTPMGSPVPVVSGESVLEPWPFAPLASGQRVGVRVRVTDATGTTSPWSAPAVVEAGLLAPEAWSARFITPDWDDDPGATRPLPLLRRPFELRAPVRSARLYATALGVYEAEINGHRVGDHVLAPGWTAYDSRLRYQTYDVTDLLGQGENVIGALLGDGWFRGRLGVEGRAFYGDRLALLAQLDIVLTDGTTQRVTTDENWLAAPGPVLESSLYDGETYDARLERRGWSRPGHASAGWHGVRIVDRNMATLVAPTGPPVRRTQEVAPVAVTLSPSGRTIVDFGQNLVGRLRVTVTGDPGRRVVLRHAEVLEGGELAVRPLRSATATDVCILRGDGPEVFEPRFTFHGFRYAEISGWSGEVTADDVRAVVVHSDMARTGHFTCSDPLVNRLHENVVWSMRGNFLDVPTDCPQRDERLGWTGDVQVFAPTACFLHDCSGFLTSWLADLAAEQRADGSVPFVVPDVVSDAHTPAAAWQDAAVIVPWTLYQRFGDKRVLADQFASMRGWVDHVTSLAGPSRLWDTGFQFGDWLDPQAPPDDPGAATTPAEIVATAYFAHSTALLARSAEVLGLDEQAAHYGELAEEVRAAFRAAYVDESGRMAADTPTAYALALAFSLLADEEQRATAGARLAELVRAAGHTMSTGFVGTPLICDELAENGHLDVAYRLLLQTVCPSWLYPVTMGATTVWERWDSLLPDGSVNPGEMTSFNHYALGAVADWLHRTVAGIAPAAPGYRRLRIAPRPGGGLSRAEASLLTPYGEAAVRWFLDGDTFSLDAHVPPNTRAEVLLPNGEATEVGAGTHHWTVGLAVPPPSDPSGDRGQTPDTTPHVSAAADDKEVAL